jgi:type IV pilus assembly protein PilX
MKFISNTKTPSRQRGAALVVALIMLLVMTVLGITAMQVTRMEERMAGNSRDVNLAFRVRKPGCAIRKLALPR